MSKPSLTDYPGYFQRYIQLVAEADLADAFNKQALIIQGFFSSISEEKSSFSYAAGKWTLKGSAATYNRL